MIVWQLGPDRAEEWRHLRLAALRDAPDAFGSRLADWQDRPLSDFAARLTDVPTFAAGEVLGQPLASAAWVAGGDPRHPYRGQLISVYAQPEARGRGYAEAAIDAALRDAALAGMTSMALNVRKTAQHAQALYHRIGFRAAACEGPAKGCCETEIQMLKDLP
ncbi:GNAT family N-acetyltransferase [Paracoccus tegillarcae]|uniref:GNAT family N-acetyltransferase n=1 Tax=Paracoccus tegillarcae TaxID=1529068 RepID=A0A2K9F208_9RHOB|nr:GNAT family N-acetyltransferase [Paracoccus tegillarcae]AUH34402.1 GNAT family N-acetyltransferase [Paracoccus tegillarcae]